MKEKNLKKNDALSFWDIRAVSYSWLEKFIPYRNLIEEIINKAEIKQNQYILDAGCGVGFLEKILAEKNIQGLKIEAIDFSSKMLYRARKRLPSQKHPLINFYQHDLDEPLSYKDNSFDAIISNNVIYALPEPNNTLREFYRVIKKNGILILSTPRPNFSFINLFLKGFGQKGKIEKIKNLFLLFPFSLLVLPFEIAISRKNKKGIHQNFTEKELKQNLKAAGFNNIKISYSYGDQNFFIVSNKF